MQDSALFVITCNHGWNIVIMAGTQCLKDSLSDYIEASSYLVKI